MASSDFCVLFQENTTPSSEQDCLLLPPVRSHSSVLPREHEVCPDTNPEGLPNTWEAQVCLINFFTERNIPLGLEALFLYLIHFFPFQIAVWASPLESVRWTSFSHKRTWRNLQVHTGVSAQLFVEREIDNSAGLLLICPPSRQTSFLRQSWVLSNSRAGEASWLPVWAKWKGRMTLWVCSASSWGHLFL